jgi:hypothetical protein
MERIKHFFMDETATAEATSTVIMIAAVGILLGGAIAAYYGHISTFFGSAGTNLESGAQNWAIPGTGTGN